MPKPSQSVLELPKVPNEWHLFTKLLFAPLNNVSYFSASYPIFGVACRWPQSSTVFPEHSMISPFFVSFESDFCYYLLDLWLKFLEKSSWKAVCSFHSLICALESNKNKRLRVSYFDCEATIKISFVIHNHVIFYFTLSKMEHFQNIFTVWLHLLVVIIVEWGGMEKRVRKLKFLSPLKKVNCFGKSNWVHSQDMYI